MYKNNLKEISNFAKTNKHFSDFNIVNNILYNLNFTKYKSNINQFGGSPENSDNIDNNEELQQYGPQQYQQYGPQQYQQYDPQQYINPQQYGQQYSFPDVYLIKPNFITDEIKTYTIKKGTKLYHSVTNKRGFNTQNIQLGNDNIILFFTPNFRLASDRVEGCSIDKQKGYIHVFEVNQDIPNIFIKLPYDTDDDISLESLKNQFCKGSKQYSGVGFFYPKNEIELFSGNMNNSNNLISFQNQYLAEDNFYSEFGLCNPTPYLNYLYTQKCQSLRKLSQPYKIDN